MASIKNKKTLLILSLISALLIVILFDLFKNQGLPGGQDSGLTSHTSPTFIMGTLVDTSLYGADAQKVSQEIFAAIEKHEKEVLSWRLEGSYISQINLGKDAVLLDDKSLNILKEAIYLSEQTEGHMDLTVGGLTRLWDFESGNNIVPPKEKIEKELEKVSYKNIEIKGNHVLLKGGASIDLGAFGKGLACDTAKEVLQKSKIKGGIVSVGGSLLIYGKAKGKDGFKIGIRNPDGQASDVFASILIDEETFISTSGMYERGFWAEGEYYHHIIDAKTGYPIENDLKSVSVFARQGMLSDALSTACFILGYDQSLALLDKFDAQAIFVFNDNKVRLTKGLIGKLEIKNEEFAIEN